MPPRRPECTSLSVYCLLFPLLPPRGSRIVALQCGGCAKEFDRQKWESCTGNEFSIAEKTSERN
jgi:hypothetical protein